MTSIGIVTPAAYFKEKGESRDDYVQREIHELNKGLADRVPKGDLVEPAHTVPNYSFQVRKFAGPGYICVGDSHRFVDPIFSFGLFVALCESEMVMDPIVGWLDGKGRERREPVPRLHGHRREGHRHPRGHDRHLLGEPACVRLPGTQPVPGPAHRHLLGAHLRAHAPRRQSTTSPSPTSAGCSRGSGRTTRRACTRSRSDRATTPSGLPCGTRRWATLRPPRAGCATPTRPLAEL